MTAKMKDENQIKLKKVNTHLNAHLNKYKISDSSNIND
jgi:hypothetical protein